MTVLVGYASAHGSTREIAERIGARIRATGTKTDVRSLDAAGDAGGYAVFVLGSAVHYQAWLPQAADFLHRNRDLLADRPVWAFSVGMPGALRGPWKGLAEREEPRLRAGFAADLRPLGHRLFSGVITRDQLGFARALAFRLMGCRYGDHRDWPVIEAWADEIAAWLTGRSQG